MHRGGARDHPDRGGQHSPKRVPGTEASVPSYMHCVRKKVIPPNTHRTVSISNLNKSK